MPRGKCPLEYYPVLTEYYTYLRGSNDYALHIPLNVQGLGYLSYQVPGRLISIKNASAEG
jgi:hypothetical protein